MKPVLLDLFCKAGGCTRGYQDAGFYVVGLDIDDQPRYCGDDFIKADALDYLDHANLSRFSAISASPPCQAYSKTKQLQGNNHPDLIDLVRQRLLLAGRPYVIENVQGAPLNSPIILKGTMFGLLVVRPRLFECNFPVDTPPDGAVHVKHAKMGRLAQSGEYIHVAGKAGRHGVLDQWKAAMDIDWMTTLELAQAIPPAYTRWVGAYLLHHLEVNQFS